MLARLRVHHLEKGTTAHGEEDEDDIRHPGERGNKDLGENNGGGAQCKGGEDVSGDDRRAAQRGLVQGCCRAHGPQGSAGSGESRETQPGRGSGQSDTDELVKKTKILAVIKALPGVGTVRAAQLLEQVRIVDTRRVGGLGARQREALIAATG